MNRVLIMAGGTGGPVFPALAAARAAEAKAVPPLDSIFSDVFEEMPDYLKVQRDFALHHYSSRGEGVNDKGEFPL